MSDSPETKVQWVKEVPPRIVPSPYDEIADEVVRTGMVAQIPVSKASVHGTTSRLRKRFQRKAFQEKYGTLKVESRAIDDEYFVFISKGDK